METYFDLFNSMETFLPLIYKDIYTNNKEEDKNLFFSLPYQFGEQFEFKDNISIHETKQPSLSYIEKLDLLIFPINPIRDWVEKEEQKINEQFSYIEKIAF